MKKIIILIMAIVAIAFTLGSCTVHELFSDHTQAILSSEKVPGVEQNFIWVMNGGYGEIKKNSEPHVISGFSWEERTWGDKTIYTCQSTNILDPDFVIIIEDGADEARVLSIGSTHNYEVTWRK